MAIVHSGRSLWPVNAAFVPGVSAVFEDSEMKSKGLVGFIHHILTFIADRHKHHGQQK